MKITEEQLNKLNEQQNKIAEVVTKIGLIEADKHALLHILAETNADMENLKIELEKQYGKVSIDLKTGEYNQIKEDELNTED